MKAFMSLIKRKNSQEVKKEAILKALITKSQPKDPLICNNSSI